MTSPREGSRDDVSGFFSRFEDERGVIVCPRSSWKKINKIRHIGVDPGKLNERTLDTAPSHDVNSEKHVKKLNV